MAGIRQGDNIEQIKSQVLNINHNISHNDNTIPTPPPSVEDEGVATNSAPSIAGGETSRSIEFRRNSGGTECLCHSAAVT